MRVDEGPTETNVAATHSQITSEQPKQHVSPRGDRKGPNLWQRCASAGFGAILVSLFTTPLDVVRVRMQSSTSCREPKSSLTQKNHMVCAIPINRRNE